MNLAEEHHERLKSIIEARGATPSGNYALDYLEATREISGSDETAEVELSMLTIVYSTLKASLSREKVLRKALERIANCVDVRKPLYSNETREALSFTKLRMIAHAALASTAPPLFEDGDAH